MDSARNAAMVFANPCAGRGKGARIMGKVRGAFAEANYSAEIVTPQSAEQCRARVREVIGAGCKTLVALGGDGTLQLLVRAAMGCAVTFGVIPAGGGNDFAAALGINDWQQGVRAIIAGKTCEVDVVSVKFAAGEEAAYLGGGGVGLDAQAARYASGRFVNWPGRSRYLASAIAALRGFTGVPVEAEFPDLDSTVIREEALLASALNTASFGGGLRLAPEARVDDGELNFVLLEKLNWAQVVGLIPRLFFSGELKTAHVRRLRAKKIRIKVAKDVWFHGDGEMLGRGPCEIAVLPRAIRVFAVK